MRNVDSVAGGGATGRVLHGSEYVRYDEEQAKAWLAGLDYGGDGTSRTVGEAHNITGEWPGSGTDRKITSVIDLVSQAVGEGVIELWRGGVAGVTYERVVDGDGSIQGVRLLVTAASGLTVAGDLRWPGELVDDERGVNGALNALWNTAWGVHYLMQHLVGGSSPDGVVDRRCFTAEAWGEHEKVLGVRIDNAVDAADLAFWAAVAARFPEITTGDVDAAWAIDLEQVTRRAVAGWVADNGPQDRPWAAGTTEPIVLEPAGAGESPTMSAWDKRGHDDLAGWLRELGVKEWAYIGDEDVYRVQVDHDGVGEAFDIRTPADAEAFLAGMRFAGVAAKKASAEESAREQMVGRQLRRDGC